MEIERAGRHLVVLEDAQVIARVYGVFKTSDADAREPGDRWVVDFARPVSRAQIGQVQLLLAEHEG